MSHGHDSSGGGFAGGMMGSMVAIILVALVAIVVLFVVFNWGGDNGAVPDAPDANGVPNGDANGNSDADSDTSFWFQQDPGYRLIA